MKYVAYIETNGTSTRILPQGQNRSFFKSPITAQKKLSKMNLDQDGRGLIYEVNDQDERKLIWSIAL